MTNSVYLPIKSNSLTDAQLLQLYLAGAVIANFACLFFNGYGGDLGYWFDWIKQLSGHGYLSFNANYPPMYVHWIYIVGKVIPALGLDIENNLMLKALMELPVLVCHLAVILIVNRIMACISIEQTKRHFILFLTAFSPAILFNGPVWGQVDLIPVTFALSAILLHFSPRFRVLSIPFYTLAILTKFQMICFAPVMGILFFRQIKTSLIGIALGIVTIAISFIPFMLNGEFVRYFKQAYINTLGEYAYTTFNAGNLWMLITGNTTPDSHIVFVLGEGTAYQKPVTAKLLGMGLFALVSLIIFIQGVKAQICKQIGDEKEQVAQILFYSVLCSIAFFTLLPAMHERYLFPAVVMSIAYAAINPGRMIYALLITLICFTNMAIINGINGSDIWHGLSSLMVFTLCFALVELFTGKYFYIFLTDIVKFTTGFKWLGLWTFLIGTYAMIAGLTHHYKKLDVELSNNQTLLTQMPVASTSQSHGSLQIDHSVDGHILSIGDQRYANGFGTHTTSNITFLMPAGAKTFSFIVGVDDEVGTADMRFSVWGDDKLLWESKTYYGFETRNNVETVDITNVRVLNLRVDQVTDMQFDHADWINPIITFDHEIKPAATPEPTAMPEAPKAQP